MSSGQVAQQCLRWSVVEMTRMARSALKLNSISNEVSPFMNVPAHSASGQHVLQSKHVLQDQLYDAVGTL